MTDLSFSQLGTYTLHARLGQGAMAQVYQATDAGGRELAIKVLHPHLTDDPGFLERFRREAMVAAHLEHPNIVRTLDQGVEGDLHYLVMGLIAGPSLKAWFCDRETPLAVETAVALVGKLADAVAYAHDRGVVHRDLKPSNILLRNGCPDDPVLTDFGVARMVEATVATAAGETLGTPAYMAPEQGQGQPGDERSDIYALGVILYELLTGRLPFEADSPYAMILRHIHTPPPSPRSFRHDLPAALEAVVLRALQKAPAGRYPDAASFAAALRGSLVAPGRPRSRTLLFALAGAALPILIALFAAWRLGWIPFATGPASSAVAGSPLINELVLQGGPAITDTWLNPDVPDQSAFSDGKVHLQGPSTPDWVLVRATLPEWPSNTELLTATLSLYAVPWEPAANRFATVAAHRLLRDWDVETASYETPWRTPGMARDVDYESAPFNLVPLDAALTQEGWLDVDITAVARDWLAGEPSFGLALRMTDDSFGMAHLWVYTAEYEDRDLWPKLTLAYRMQ